MDRHISSKPRLHLISSGQPKMLRGPRPALFEGYGQTCQRHSGDGSPCRSCWISSGHTPTSVWRPALATRIPPIFPNQQSPDLWFLRLPSFRRQGRSIYSRNPPPCKIRFLNEIVHFPLWISVQTLARSVRLRCRQTESRESSTMDDMVFPSRKIDWTLADLLSTYRYCYLLFFSRLRRS